MNRKFRSDRGVRVCTLDSARPKQEEDSRAVITANADQHYPKLRDTTVGELVAVARECERLTGIRNLKPTFGTLRSVRKLTFVSMGLTMFPSTDVVW